MTTEPNAGLPADLPSAPATPPDPAPGDRAPAEDWAESAEAGAAQNSRLRLRQRIVTPPAIYGTLLVSAIIGTAEDGDTDIEVFGTTISTLAVFWIAHVFAEAIAHYGRSGKDSITMGQALRHSLGLSAGLLYAGILPCGVLLLGALGAMPESIAYALSLLLPIALLAALGWLAVADRGGRWPAKLFAAWITSFLGFIVIILKIVFH